MQRTSSRSLHLVAVLIVILGTIASSIGLLFTTGGTASDFVNQYGDTVRMYGDGLYANDSYFAAPIFRGTDFTILVLAVPLLMTALILDRQKKTLRSRLFLTSMIALFAYYAASLALGVTYNALHLVYIALFACGLFGLIMAIGSINAKELAIVVSRSRGLPYRGMYIFMALTGVALILAWLPDILSAFAAGRPLALIEVYTTSVTNVLDMGVIGPTALICLFELRRRTGMGYILSGMLFSVCIVIGVMLPIQTAFQLSAGIELPVPVIVTKVASFVVLAIFAAYFQARLLSSMKGEV